MLNVANEKLIQQNGKIDIKNQFNNSFERVGCNDNPRKLKIPFIIVPLNQKIPNKKLK